MACAVATAETAPAVAPHLVWRRAGLSVAAVAGLSVAPQLRDGACFKAFTYLRTRLLALLVLYGYNRQGLPVAAVAPHL